MGTTGGRAIAAGAAVVVPATGAVARMLAYTLRMTSLLGPMPATGPTLQPGER